MSQATDTETVRPVFGQPYEIPDPSPPEGPDPYGNPDAEPAWLDVDWPAQRRRIEIAGSTANYVDMGESREGELDLLLIHGLGGSWQNWLEQIPYFARSRRVVALDLPGFGASPMPDWDPTVKEYGELLAGFSEELGLVDTCVVGNSMGGFIAAEAAIERPDLLEKLVLVSAAGVSSVQVRREPAAVVARMLAATAPLMLKFQESTFKRAGVRTALFQGVFHRPDELHRELLWEQLQSGPGRPGFVEALMNLLGYDILDSLEDVEVPALIVWGRQDRVVPSSDAAEWGRRLKNSRTVILDQTGHAPQLERPVRFNRLLEAFLAES